MRESRYRLPLPLGDEVPFSKGLMARALVLTGLDPERAYLIARRADRDLTERGRTLDQVIRQYESSVRPMHLQFVEPSKRYADLVIPEGGYNVVAIDLLKTKIRALLRESG